MRLQPVAQFRHRQAIYSCRTAVLHDALERPPHVAAFNHPLHEQVTLRFRLPSRRRARLGTRGRPPRIPSASCLPGSLIRDCCLLLAHRDSAVLLSVSMFGPSASPPTTPSADFWRRIPVPFDTGSSWHPARSPRVLRTHLRAYACRIYATAFRASTGLHRSLPAHPAVSPHIRFLFVRPALCPQLPPDSQSPAKPLPLS